MTLAHPLPPISPRGVLRAAAACAAGVLSAALPGGGCACPSAPPRCDDGAAVCRPIDVGSTPNDVKLTTCAGAPVAVVVESGDARVTTYGLPDGKVVASALLPDGSDPFALALDEADGRALVTLRRTDTLALLDWCSGAVLEAPQITDAHQPQAVIFDGTRFVVSFTNVSHDGSGPADPPVIAPGVVASFTLSGDALSPGPSVTLPCKDPQGLVAGDAGTVWAACTGPLNIDGSGNEAALEDGALVEIDLEAASVVATVDAARTAPGTPALVDGTLFVGSDVAPKLLAAPAGDGNALGDALALDGPAVDSVFQVKGWDGPLLLAGQFSADALRVVDVSRTPPILVDTVQAGAGGTAFRGLLAFDARPGFGDVDAVALLTLSAELVPLRLHLLDCCGGAP